MDCVIIPTRPVMLCETLQIPASALPTIELTISLSLEFNIVPDKA